MSDTRSGAPFKVLFLIDGLWVGGTERSLAEILPELAQLGVTPVVVCLKRCGEGVEAETAVLGLDLRFLEGQGVIRQIRTLRRILKTERPQILHSALFKANLIGRLATVGTGVVNLNSLVNTPYTAARLQDPRLNPLSLRLVQILDACTGRLLTDHFHAVSSAAKAAAVRHLYLPPGRITVVERGRDPQRLGTPSPERRADARKALGLRDVDEVLVNVGRVDFQKGQIDLLRALARLIPRRPDVVLLIAGRSGSQSARLEAVSQELGLGTRLRFLGHRSDIPEILAAADLFVFPSRFEGFPGAVLEAMALGLPIVAADIAPVREIVEVEGNGLLVRPGDEEALAGALTRLLDARDEATAFGAASRRLFLQRHTLETSVRGTLRLYRSLTSGHGFWDTPKRSEG